MSLSTGLIDSIDQAAAAPSRARRRLWPRTGRRREAVIGWLLIGPIMLYWFIFGFIPLVSVVVLSFVHWDGFSDPRWVGFHNYQTLWRFPLYRDALWHTLLIGGLVLVTGITVAFGIALLLNAKIRFRGFYRTVWYLPTIVSFAIVAQMWNVFVDPINGVFDNVLRVLRQPPILWSLSSFWMIVQVVILTTWKGVGSTMIIFLAGLQGIDQTLYEAGRIDGAGRWPLFRYITLPSLRPIGIFVVITGALGAIQIFEPIYLFSKGGPFESTTVLIYRIYEDAFLDNQFGLACATSVIFALLGLTFTVFQLRFFGKQID